MTVAQPVASRQFLQWKQWPKTYREPTHEEWLAEVLALQKRCAAQQLLLNPSGYRVGGSDLPMPSEWLAGFLSRQSLSEDDIEHLRALAEMADQISAKAKAS